MSTTVDNRVVSIKFDNNGFESKVASTIRALQNLKANSDMTESAKSFKQLDQAVTSVNVTGLSKGLGTVQTQFSALSVVGMTVLSNITNAAVDAGRTITRSLTGLVTSGGWRRSLNIEQAKFQLQGLNVAWKDIEKDIDYGVKDTAYGLDAAAKAASQLVASGVEFGETFGETGNSPMAKALRGISGVAAMTNSSFEEISPIFTTIAGQGKVMTMQLRQLENRGLNAAATIAKSLGTTEEAVREMVSDGKIDFATFSKAMDDAFGEHAKDANRTFTGALSNIQAALARTGEAFATPLKEDLRDVLNTARIVINNFNTAVKPVAKVFADIGRALSGRVITSIIQFNEALGLSADTFDRFASKIKGKFGFSDWEKMENAIAHTGFALDDFYQSIYDAATSKMTDKEKESLDALVKSYGSLRASVNGGWITADYLYEGMKNLFMSAGVTEDEFNSLNYEIDGTTKTAKEWVAVIAEANQVTSPKRFQGFADALRTIKDYFNAIKRAAKDVFAGFFEADAFTDLKKAVGELADALKLTDDEANGLTKEYKVLFKIIRGGLTIITRLATGVVKVVTAFTKVRHAILGWLGRQEGLNHALDGFRAIGYALYNSVLLPMSNIFGNIVGEIGNFVTALFGSNKQIDASNDKVKNLRDKLNTLRETLSPIGNLFSSFGDKVVSGINSIPTAFSSIAGMFSGFGKPLESEVKVVSASTKGFKNSINDVSKATKSTESPMSIFIQNLIDYIDRIKEAAAEGDVFAGVLEALSPITTVVSNGLALIGKGFEWVGKQVDPILNNIRTLSEDLVGFYKKLTGIESWEDAGEKLHGFFENFSFGGALMTLYGAGMVKMIFSISDAIKSFAKTSNKVPDLLKNFTKTLKAYQQDLKASALKKTAEGIKEIAIAIAILAGAAVALSFIDPSRFKEVTDFILKLVVILSIAVVAINGLRYAMAKLKAPSNTAAEALEGALSSLVGGVKDYLKAAKWRAIATSVLIFAAALMVLVKAFKKIADMDILWTDDRVQKNFIAIGVGVLALAAAMRIAGDGAFKAGIGLLAMIAGMKMLAKTITSLKENGFSLGLENVKEPKDLLKTPLAPIAGLIIAVGILSAMLKGSGNDAIKIGIGVLAISASLYILLSVVHKMTEMMHSDADYAKLQKSFILIGSLLLAIAVVVSAMSNLKEIKAGPIMALSAFLIVLVGAIAVLTGLASMNLAGTLAAVGALCAVLISLGVAFRLMGSMKTGGPGIMAFLEMLMLLASASMAIGMLAQQDWDSLAAAAGGIAGVLIVLTAVFKYLNSMRVGKTINEKIGSILLLSLALIEIGTALWIASQQPWEQIAASATAMGALLGELAIIMGVLTSIKQGGDMMMISASMVVMAAALIEIAAALAIVGQIPTDRIKGAAIALGVLMGVMVAIGALVGFVPVIAAGLEAVALTFIQFGAAAILLGTGMLITSVAVQNFLDTLIQFGNTAPEVFQNVANNILVFIQSLAEIAPAAGFAAGMIVAGFLKGLAASVPMIVIGVLMIGKAIIDTFKELLGINSPSTVFEDFGTNIVQGLLEGLQSMIDKIKTKIDEIVDNIKKPFEDINLIEDGKNIINGLIEGIKAKFEELKTYISNTAEALPETVKKILGIASPSKVMKQLGKYTIEGFIEGWDSGTAMLVKSAKDTMKLLTYTLKETATGFDLSLKTTKLKETSEGVFKVLDKNLKNETYLVQNASGKITKVIDKTSEKLKSLKSTYSDLAYGQKLFAKTGSLAVVSKLGNYLYSLTDNGKALAGLANTADESLEQMQQRFQDTAEAFNNFDNALKSGLSEAYGMFDKFEKKSTVSWKKIKKNMESQIKGYSELLSGYATLKDRGISTEALKYLMEMGVEGMGYVKGLVRDTSGEAINEFNAMFSQLSSLKDSIPTTCESMIASVIGDSGDQLEVLKSKQQFKQDIQEAKEAIEETQEAKDLLSKTAQDLENELLLREAKQKARDAGLKESFISQINTDNMNDVINADADKLRTANKQYATMLKVQVQETQKSQTLAMTELKNTLTSLKNKGLSPELLLQVAQGSLDYTALFAMSKKEIAEYNKQYRQMLREQYLAIIEAQLEEKQKLKENLEKIKSMGGSDALLAEIVKGTYDADAIVNMTKDEIKEMSDKLGAIGFFDAYLDGVYGGKDKKENVDKAKKAGAEIGDSTADGVRSTYDNNKDAGGDIGSGIMKGIMDSFKEEDVNTSIKPLKDSLFNVIQGDTKGAKPPTIIDPKDAEDQGTNAAKSSVKALDDTIDNSKETISNSGKKVVKALKKGGINEEKGAELAKHICAGLINGLNQYGGLVAATAKEVAKKALKSAEKELGVASPSKEFAKIGMFVDMGFANGITNYSDLVSKSAENLGGSALSMVQSAMKSVSEAMDEDMSTTPVITPLINLDSAEDTMSRLADMFNNTLTTTMAAKARMSIENAPNVADAINGISFEQDNSDVVRAVNSLRGEIGELAERMNNLQVVLDSGRLVGSIAGQMDDAIGRRQIMAGRSL